jgi:PAS domain S-box-containing protein
MSAQGETGASGSRARPAGSDAGDLLDLLIEQVVDYAIYLIDPGGRIASWNEGAKRIKGYLPEEIIGQPYAVFFTEEDRRAGKPQEILGNARAHGRYQEEGWRVRKDGSRFWASVVMTALRDASGELRGFAKITRDLTERVRADEQARRAAEERAARRQAELDAREVRRSRDQLHLILRNVAEGVTVMDSNGKLVFVNDAAARLCGFESAAAMQGAPEAELLGRFRLFHEDGTPFPVDELPGRLALGGTTSTTIVRFRSKGSGEERWSFVSGAPVLDEAGNVELSVSVFREITDRRRSEQAWQFLAEASAALGSSLDYQETLAQLASLAVPRIADWCGVDVLGPDGELEQLAVAHVDPAKRDLAEEWRRRWPPPRNSLAYRVVSSGQPQLLPEITDEMIDVGAPDPEQRRVARELGLRSAMLVPLVVDRQPAGVISFITAESGRRYGPEDLILATEIAHRASLAIENARAYTEARTALQTRDNFLAIASHELRTPLSGLMVLMTSLVRAASSGRILQLGPEGLKDRMLKAERQAMQLARLIDRLLDVSRLSARDLRLERERVDFAEIARDAISRYDDEAAEHGTRIDLRVSGATVGVWDRSRIDQVITNLVGNAVKYGRGAAITVSISASASGYLRLTVRDEGPGIPAEDQERIFGQFERAAPSQNVPGMGLGLWLVRRIVAAHGGTVTLESNPGHGTTFAVILPMTPDGSSERAGAPSDDSART